MSRLQVRVRPGQREEGVGWDPSRQGWTVDCRERPIEGAATDAAARLLAAALGLRRASVRIARGARSPSKVYEVDGLSVPEIEERLRRAVGASAAPTQRAAVVTRGARGAEPRGPPRIQAASSPLEYQTARELVEEYAASLSIDLGFQGFEKELAGFPGEYAPPAGVVLLAFVGRSPAGVVALRPLEPGSCEMKRLFVREPFRGRGIGRALATSLVEVAAVRGYRRMRLDTIASMASAIELYRQLGFREIGAYRYNPFPDARYFELVLPGGHEPTEGPPRRRRHAGDAAQE